MKINIHAGHNPDGMVACGAIGLIRESTEARKVKDIVKSMLMEQGHIVYDCTCNNGTDQQDVLEKIVNLCNDREVDLDVSIHFNAGAQMKMDGNTTGTEVFVYSKTSAAVKYAQQVVDSISTIGYQNRGVKENPDLYVLKHTKAPAVLIECCFVDDPDDVAMYNADQMATAIVAGIAGQCIDTISDSMRLASMGKEEFVQYIGQLATVDMRKSGILASVTAAQSILESGYGKSDLALNALNLGGMKADLSGNTWKSEWDGRTYTKETAEQKEDGSYITVTANFRSYPSVAAYLADHSAYLSGARERDKLRYEGIVGCEDYRRAFQILKNGGYATSKDYVDKLCAVVEKWNLTRFDVGGEDLGIGEIYTVSVADVWSKELAMKIQRELAMSGTVGVIHKVKIMG